jgi:hypothetical protein
MKAMLGTFGLCVLMAGLAFAQNADPLAGTWKLNVAKSDMKGDTASSQETIVFKVVGDEESFTSHAVAANNGEKETTTYAAKYGGADGPMKSVYVAKDGKQRVESATVAVKRVSDRVRERFVKRDGKVVLHSRRVISDDGKTLTSSILGKDASGKEVVNQTRVFDKQ